MSASPKAVRSGGPPGKAGQAPASQPPAPPIHGRAAFDEGLQAEWLRAGREQEPLALLLIEVDHFTAYARKAGAAAAEDSLQQIAAALMQAVFRPTDLVARYAEAQFAIVLPTHEAGARVVAARVRHAVNGLSLPHRAGEGGIVTVSIGVAALTPAPEQPAAGLVTLAEDALAQARRIGHDCIVSQDWIA